MTLHTASWVNKPLFYKVICDPICDKGDKGDSRKRCFNAFKHMEMVFKHFLPHLNTQFKCAVFHFPVNYISIYEHTGTEQLVLNKAL